MPTPRVAPRGFLLEIGKVAGGGTRLRLCKLMDHLSGDRQSLGLNGLKLHFQSGALTSQRRFMFSGRKVSLTQGIMFVFV